MARLNEIMPGTLDLLILKALSLHPIHGWGITSRIHEMSRGSLRVGQGSLYPALHRCERRGWVTSYWRATENNRLARYYDLTPTGKRTIAQQIARWRHFAGAVDLVLGG